jgi:abortive infection bacteriophage resistance protein
VAQLCKIGGNKTCQGYTCKRILKLAGSSLSGGRTVTRPFDKPATTYAEQLALLQQRGMSINDEAGAEFYLEHLNYYRLGAYWLPFESDHTTHQFKSGTCFDDVLRLYFFDRELRLLVLDAIERIEVSVRSQWAYQLGHLHSPHAHLDSTLFSRYWQENLKRLTDEVNRADEIFIQHMLATYSEPLPPVWAVCEVMSLGLLSRWYTSLQPKSTRRAIANPYGIDESVLGSWLQHLSLVRNLCAHHSRLWNREFAITPKMPKSKSQQIAQQFVPGSRKLYNTLVILLHFLNVISPRHGCRSRLKALIAKHSIPVAAMGFPLDWKKRSIWQEEES